VIKVCRSHRAKCEARIKQPSKPSLCCKYGWCGWANPVTEKEAKK